MRTWHKGLSRTANAGLNPLSMKWVFPVLTLVSLVVLLLLARHTSTDPSVSGRWSWRFATLLAFQGSVTIALLVISIPGVNATLLRRSAWKGTGREAWSVLIAGLAFLPLLWLLLRKVLFVEKDPVIALFASLILMAAVAIVTTIMWKCGAASLNVSLPPFLPLILLLLLAGQLLLTAHFSGQVPAFHLSDETRIVGNSLRQFAFPDRFVLLLPDRNASTWFYFQGFWVLGGAWMKLVGAGVQQLRFLNILVAWLGIPFLFLTARRLFGHFPALVVAVCGIVFSIHFVSARTDIWVATATTIAFYCFVAARDPGATRIRLLSFLCGALALSAIDGHPYGSTFALMFCLLHAPICWRMLRGIAGSKEKKVLAGFLAGFSVYSLAWFMYHVVLPGINPATLPDVIRATMDIETSLGEATHGTGLTIENLIKFVQLFLYSNPYVFVTSLLGLVVTLRHGGVHGRSSLLVAFGAGAMVLLTLAHVTKFYAVFWLPFMCLWTGVGIAALFSTPAKPVGRDGRQVKLGALYLLLALVLLCTFQAVETAEIYKHEYELAWQLSAIGQEIDRMLPQEDLALAGTPEISLGMLWRLNYGAFCPFTLDDPEYWPLDQPMAVISTPGWDKGCDLLADWLTEHDFQAARCFPGHGLGEGVTILYLSPELMTPEAAVDCTPAHLSLLEETA